LKAILGRLADLGLKELFDLLSSAGVAGGLDVETTAGKTALMIRDGLVAGGDTPVLAVAVALRSGSFCFRPGPVAEDAEWISLEELLARVQREAERLTPVPVLAGAGEAATAEDPLGELRSSLEQIPLPTAGASVTVVTADPRPYRALEQEWGRRGWSLSVEGEPVVPERSRPDLIVLHPPSAAAMAGQGEHWLELLRRGVASEPPIPVVWVGGLTDPAVRHRAVMAGAEYLLPSPLGEAGETARWFRDELTVVVERTLLRHGTRGRGEAEALRDFFLALHVDAPPQEVRASLLRFAAKYFGRAVLLAVRQESFEALGSFGLGSQARPRLERGTEILERAVAGRTTLEVDPADPDAGQALVRAFGAGPSLNGAVVFPVFARGECVALLVGDAPTQPGGRAEPLAALLARAGDMMGL
jgi:hypothetical protein